MNILMVGYNSTLLKSISDSNLSILITVIEEEELFRKKELYTKSFTCLKEVIFSPYQQVDDYLILLDDLRFSEFNAVIPGLEYAVTAANDLAYRLGLPFAGQGVDMYLTNKIALRKRCEKFNIPQPLFKQVKNKEDIEEFFTGSPIIIKPANRQASLGVIKIESREEITEAWNELLSIEEKNQLASRTMEWSYLVEECMLGNEISSEVFIKDGNILFINHTEKKTTKGRYSVELSHIVPARIEHNYIAKVNDYIKDIINAFKFENGVLHFEIMLTKDGPKIIEVAGRPPGDMIFKLIEYSYKFNPYILLTNVLSNQFYRETLPLEAKQGSCIFFLTYNSQVEWNGELNDSILESPNLLDWSIYLKPGDSIKEIKNSWDRAGHVIVKGSNATEAYDLAEHINKNFFKQEEVNFYV